MQINCNCVDIEAIISNYPEEDFDEQKAMLLMTHLNIIQPAQQFSNYREIIFQWLNEAKVKKADCRLITLVVALMKSHLGRVMSKLLPTCKYTRVSIPIVNSLLHVMVILLQV